MRVLIIGNFGSAIKNYSGQTERTKAIYDALQEMNAHKIKKLEIGFRKTPFALIKFILGLIGHVYSSDRIVVVAAQNGIKAFIKLFNFLKLQGKVIILPTGGWFSLDEFDLTNLKRFKAIIIQANKHFEFIKSELPQNTYHLPNFRKIYNKSFLKSQNSQKTNPILRVIFNSRVSTTKGIYELINAINSINQSCIKFTLDIYGQITKDEYQKLIKFVSQEIKYLGEYSPENVSTILKNYDILAFPSYYPGEGQPGVLLDALFNKIPVIATKWNFNEELVKNDLNGFLINPKSENDIVNCLLKYYENPTLINSHSKNAEIIAQNFSFEKCTEKLKAVL